MPFTITNELQELAAKIDITLSQLTNLSQDAEMTEGAFKAMAKAMEDAKKYTDALYNSTKNLKTSYDNLQIAISSRADDINHLSKQFVDASVAQSQLSDVSKKDRKITEDLAKAVSILNKVYNSSYEAQSTLLTIKSALNSSVLKESNAYKYLSVRYGEVFDEAVRLAKINKQEEINRQKLSKEIKYATMQYYELGDAMANNAIKCKDLLAKSVSFVSILGGQTLNLTNGKEALLKYNSAMFIASRSAQVYGANLSNIGQVTKDVVTTTVLSSTEFTQLAGELTKAWVGVKPSIMEIGNLTKNVQSSFGPDVDTIKTKMGELYGIQNKFPSLYRQMQAAREALNKGDEAAAAQQRDMIIVRMGALGASAQEQETAYQYLSKVTPEMKKQMELQESENKRIQANKELMLEFGRKSEGLWIHLNKAVETFTNILNNVPGGLTTIMGGMAALQGASALGGVVNMAKDIKDLFSDIGGVVKGINVGGLGGVEKGESQVDDMINTLATGVDGNYEGKGKSKGRTRKRGGRRMSSPPDMSGSSGVSTSRSRKKRNNRGGNRRGGMEPPDDKSKRGKRKGGFSSPGAGKGKVIQNVASQLGELASSFGLVGMAVGALATTTTWAVKEIEKAKEIELESTKNFVNVNKQGKMMFETADKENRTKLGGKDLTKYEQRKKQLLDDMSNGKPKGEITSADHLRVMNKLSKEFNIEIKQGGERLQMYPKTAAELNSRIQQINNEYKEQVGLLNTIQGSLDQQINSMEYFGSVSKEALTLKVTLADQGFKEADDALNKVKVAASSALKLSPEDINTSGITKKMNEIKAVIGEKKTRNADPNRQGPAVDVSGDELELKEYEGLLKEITEKEAERDKARQNQSQVQIAMSTKENDIMVQKNQVWEQQTDTIKALMESVQMGAGPNLDMIITQIRQAESQIGQLQKAQENLSNDMVKAAKDKGMELQQADMDRLQQARTGEEAMAVAMSIAKEKLADKGADKQKEAAQSLFAIEEQRIKKYDEELKQRKKIVDLTKEMREGYLEAIRSSMIGFGRFSEIISSQDTAYTRVIKHMREVSKSINAGNTVSVGGILDNPDRARNRSIPVEYAQTGLVIPDNKGTLSADAAKDLQSAPDPGKWTGPHGSPADVEAARAGGVAMPPARQVSPGEVRQRTDKNAALALGTSTSQFGDGAGGSTLVTTPQVRVRQVGIPYATGYATGAYASGGVVERTGPAYLTKGEYVVSLPEKRKEEKKQKEVQRNYIGNFAGGGSVEKTGVGVVTGGEVVKGIGVVTRDKKRSELQLEYDSLQKEIKNAFDSGTATVNNSVFMGMLQRRNVITKELSALRSNTGVVNGDKVIGSKAMDKIKKKEITDQNDKMYMDNLKNMESKGDTSSITYRQVKQEVNRIVEKRKRAKKVTIKDEKGEWRADGTYEPIVANNNIAKKAVAITSQTTSSNDLDVPVAGGGKSLEERQAEQRKNNRNAKIRNHIKVWGTNPKLAPSWMTPEEIATYLISGGSGPNDKLSEGEASARRKADEQAERSKQGEVEAKRKADELAEKSREGEASARRKADEQAERSKQGEASVIKKAPAAAPAAPAAAPAAPAAAPAAPAAAAAAAPAAPAAPAAAQVGAFASGGVVGSSGVGMLTRGEIVTRNKMIEQKAKSKRGEISVKNKVVEQEGRQTVKPAAPAAAQVGAFASGGVVGSSGVGMLTRGEIVTSPSLSPKNINEPSVPNKPSNIPAPSKNVNSYNPQEVEVSVKLNENVAEMFKIATTMAKGMRSAV